MLYRVTPVAVIGGSFLSGLAGHNISEAAAAGCAVMTGELTYLCLTFLCEKGRNICCSQSELWHAGPHVGHFYHMLVEMWQINPLAVKQVTKSQNYFSPILLPKQNTIL
jgi:3-deoxy-D-manno-octulosonic-acid transferase